MTAVRWVCTAGMLLLAVGCVAEGDAGDEGAPAPAPASPRQAAGLQSSVAEPALATLPRESARRTLEAQSGAQVARLQPNVASTHELIERLRPTLRRSTDDLRLERLPEGGTSVAVEAGFRHATLIHRRTDGSLGYHCVEDLEGAKKIASAAAAEASP